MDFQTLAIATAASAVIVLFGALYAILLALGHMKRSAHYYYLSYASYAVLAFATWALVEALQLSQIWLVLIATLLVGYLVGPQMIWRLSVAIHNAGDDLEPEQNLSKRKM